MKKIQSRIEGDGQLWTSHVSPVMRLFEYIVESQSKPIVTNYSIWQIPNVAKMHVRRVCFSNGMTEGLKFKRSLTMKGEYFRSVCTFKRHGNIEILFNCWSLFSRGQKKVHRRIPNTV